MATAHVSLHRCRQQFCLCPHTRGNIARHGRREPDRSDARHAAVHTHHSRILTEHNAQHVHRAGRGPGIRSHRPARQHARLQAACRHARPAATQAGTAGKLPAVAPRLGRVMPNTTTPAMACRYCKPWPTGLCHDECLATPVRRWADAPRPNAQTHRAPCLFQGTTCLRRRRSCR